MDLREQYLEVPHQTAITQDNAAIAIDFIIFYKVLDPLTTVLAVQDFKGAGINIASTTLRSVVGDMTLDYVLSKREQMNDVLRAKLDDVTERWGVKVTNVEVREIKPPPAVLEAMTRQMGAERTRRALVTEAEGQKSASITVAEGEKQSAILQAEGERQAARAARPGLRGRSEPDPRGGWQRGQNDDDAPVPGDLETNRDISVHQVRDPRRAHHIARWRRERQWCQRHQWGDTRARHPERVSQPLAGG